MTTSGTPMAETPMSEFPDDWRSAVVLVAHPDDVEYGLAAAVDRWTGEGRTVGYVLASSGEVGIEGMDPAEAGPLREGEQRRAGLRVGVSDVAFLGLPDSALRNDPSTRQAVLAAVTERRPDIVVVGYYGPAWGPDVPNQSDHIEFGHASQEALQDTGIRIFEQAPEGDLLVEVDGHLDAAVASLAEHRVYLEVLDPDTPVIESARRQIESACGPKNFFDGRPGIALRIAAVDGT